MKEILYAQPDDVFPRLNIRKLKKGVIENHPIDKASHLNEIFFTDISRNYIKLLERRGDNYEIRLLNTKIMAPTMNWSVRIEMVNLTTTLIGRGYSLPPSFIKAYKSMCIIIEIEGDKGKIENLISEYLKFFDHSPYMMTKWDKFEKKFGITKEECISAWEKYRQK